jgi:hypothetical protein
MLDGFPAKASAMTFPIRAVIRKVQRSWNPRRKSWATETIVAVFDEFP